MNYPVSEVKLSYLRLWLETRGFGSDNNIQDSSPSLVVMKSVAAGQLTYYAL